MKTLIIIAIILILALPCFAGQMQVDISKYMNNDGISSDDPANRGSLDKGGFTFPAAEFPANGTTTIDGVKYKLASPSAAKNNIACNGQVISLPKGRISKIHVLATAVNGSYIEDITVKRTDNTSYIIDFAISDWCVQSQYNEKPGINFSHRRSTKPETPKCMIWDQTIYLMKSGKPATAIRLPKEPNIHIFAITVE